MRKGVDMAEFVGEGFDTAVVVSTYGIGVPDDQVLHIVDKMVPLNSVL